MPNLVEIGQNAAEIWRFFDFPRWRTPRWRPSAILDLLCEWLDHPRRAFWWSLSLCKIWLESMRWFRWYASCSISWLWLENAYSRPFWGVFGAQFPHKMSLIVLTPKTTVLGRNHVIWAIKREYRPRGSSWALEREKKDRTRKKSHKWVIFHL